MPVRRRNATRRETNLAWDMMFLSGHDFFSDLVEAGVIADANAHPDDAITLAAWERYGADFIARNYDPHHTPWAVRELGEP